jgi:hypothetical protein
MRNGLSLFCLLQSFFDLFQKHKSFDKVLKFKFLRKLLNGFNCLVSFHVYSFAPIYKVFAISFKGATGVSSAMVRVLLLLFSEVCPYSHFCFFFLSYAYFLLSLYRISSTRLSRIFSPFMSVTIIISLLLRTKNKFTLRQCPDGSNIFVNTTVKSKPKLFCRLLQCPTFKY